MWQYIRPRYNVHVLLLKQFILATVLISSGSFFLSTLLVSPTPLDTTLAYEKTEPPEQILRNPPQVTLVDSADTVTEMELPKVSASPKEEPAQEEEEVEEKEQPDKAEMRGASKIFSVPFFSQFDDITPTAWKKIGCGIASLAMLIEFYEPGSASVDTLLQEGIEKNAYLNNAGWTYAGLITVSEKYGITGITHDFGTADMETAFGELETALKKGPVMVSVHYTFDPQNPIPHLVVLNGIKDDLIYYNDPAEKIGGGSLSISKFQKSWKKRYIEFYPA